MDSTLDLGMRGFAGSKEGHWENVNELHDSANPNVGWALRYIKAMHQQKMIHGAVARSALQVTEGACCIVPETNKMNSNDP